MTHDYLLAVDPGKHGAIAIFDIATGAPVAVIDFPLTPANEIDYGTLADMVVPYRGKAIAVIETTYSFKMGRNSAMHFGEVLGAWRGVLAASDIALAQSLDPATWKKALGLWKTINWRKAERYVNSGCKSIKIFIKKPSKHTP